MIAIDTNVVIRLITDDDPEQAARVRALLERSDVFLPLTVVLEAAWVLQRSKGYSRVEVTSAIASFCGLPSVTVEEPSRVFRALGWAERGMDFADALHLAGAGVCSEFLTFDKRMMRRANPLATQPPVRTP